MLMKKYLIRFDDVNERMDWDKFLVLKKHLEKFNIKSILGVVPNCKDEFLMISQKKKNYYEYLRKCKKYGDSIAQHGFEHKYDSISRGIYGNSKNSEFAGHTYDKQLKKLQEGKTILMRESIWEPIFMAPAHTFDKNTLKALNKLNFSKVLDGFSLFPFKLYNLIFIPQIYSKPLPEFIPGISQLCIHINTISNKELNYLKNFIEENHAKFIELNQLEVKNNINISKIIEIAVLTSIVKTVRFIKKNLSNLINYKLKFLCLTQRIYYKLRLHKLNIDKWHLKGTFFCRKYKNVCLKLITEQNPQLYIDIGCGLGEILCKVKLNKNYKLGYDKDKVLNKANLILHANKFNFFSSEKKLIKHANKLKIKNNGLIIISMLNFVHNLSPRELKELIKKYLKNIGPYTLLIDNIFKKEKVYKYNHHRYLFNHDGLIKYLYKVDNLRSLYCIKIK